MRYIVVRRDDTRAVIAEGLLPHGSVADCMGSARAEVRRQAQEGLKGRVTVRAYDAGGELVEQVTFEARPKLEDRDDRNGTHAVDLPSPEVTAG